MIHPQLTAAAVPHTIKWKTKQPTLAKHLQRAADTSLIYEINPNDIVTVVVDGEYRGYHHSYTRSTQMRLSQ